MRKADFAFPAFAVLVVMCGACSKSHQAARPPAPQIETRTDTDAPPPPFDKATYKSSALGLAIDYPRDWQKFRRFGCGNPAARLTTYERLDERCLYPIGFAAHKWDVYFLVDYYRRLPPDIEKRRGRSNDEGTAGRTSDMFQLTCGLVADKFVGDGDYLNEDQPTGATRALYQVVAKNRFVQMTAVCPTVDYPDLEPNFDAMARSLRLLPPTESGPAGTVTVYQGAGFRFEYPADWAVVRDWDDANQPAAGITDGLSIVPPMRGKIRPWPEPTIGCSQYPPEPGCTVTPDAFAADMKKKFDAMPGETSYEWSTIERRDGPAGVRFDYTVRIEQARPTTLRASLFALPLSNGRLQVLNCSGTPAGWRKYKKVFERAGKTFDVENHSGVSQTESALLSEPRP